MFVQAQAYYDSECILFVWKGNGEWVVSLRTADVKETYLERKSIFIFFRLRKCPDSIRMEMVMYSVNSFTLNTLTLLHKAWVVWYSTSDRRATGNVKATFVFTVRYLLFRRFY
jgi:hypothetical protein